ncbi:uncharacterized protein LOC131151769 [Malania oleifera]|uniref:uncharacterized protein LOC131151769 n=1 Tax=Malania oleifera TaxID=397392 RepID=UPI0025AE52A2|nr:uncharacterized protein LOC131151769 [Malania oleifera]
MEGIPPMVAKKLWNLARLVRFTLRKGISKTKLMLDLHLRIKRSKVAGKALTDLLLHHHSSLHRRSDDPHVPFTSPWDYEFSCSNSPAYLPYNHFHVTRRRGGLTCPPPPANADDSAEAGDAAEGSPLELPGFGRSTAVRQLRITDSPFPMKDAEGDSHVDKAAEEFIARFYMDLRMQNMMAGSETPYYYHCL